MGIKRLCQAYGIELLEVENFDGYYYLMNKHITDFSYIYKDKKDAIRKFKEHVKEALEDSYWSLNSKSVIYKEMMQSF